MFLATTTTYAASSWYVATSGSDAADCRSAATACKTISAAIGKAADGDTIVIAAGVYTEQPGLIGKSLALMGAGTENTIVDGGGGGGTGFILGFDSTSSMSNLTIRNGPGGLGIGPKNHLALSDVLIAGNQRAGTGAGILNYGVLTGTRVRIQDNNATFNAGGIFNFGQITLTHSEISGNQAAGVGGGIWNNKTGVMTLTNVLIHDNTVTNADSRARHIE